MAFHLGHRNTVAPQALDCWDSYPQLLGGFRRYGRALEERDCCWMAGVRFVAALTRGAWDGFVMLFHGTGICQL